MMMSKLTCKTELRHLNQQERRKIENLLNASDCWKEIISVIPKELDPLIDNEDDQDLELLINNSKYELLEQQKFVKNGSPSKALLDYWSTYSYRRPTIEHLIYYSAKCNLNRLVEYLIIDLLKASFQIEFSEKTKKILINKFRFDKEQNEKFDQFIDNLRKDPPHHFEIDFNVVKEEVNNKSNDKEILEPDCEIKKFDFDLIQRYTNNFNDTSLKDGGNKLGEGGFGEVFLARIPKNELNIDELLNCELDYTNQNYLIAVKKVSNEFKNQYLNELKYLEKFRHPNLLNLIGFAYSNASTNTTATLCILSEYMINGSLQDCLLQTNFRPIDVEQRIKITKQIIDAICHLHTFEKVPLVHRDIKSSNILLDRNFNSKLCDFGLARRSSIDKTTMKTFNIIGTSAYMSPEAFKGKISVKMDTFSFGIVLLEILTGLPPVNKKRDGGEDCDEEGDEDILSYITDNVFGEIEDSDYDQNEYEQKVIEHLDKRAGNWNSKIAIQLFDLAIKSTNDRKKERPTMIEVRELFEQIISEFKN